jgi:tetratricopeptide (TPR) repeat protein
LEKIYDKKLSTFNSQLSTYMKSLFKAAYCLCLLLLFFAPLHAQKKTFTREYTYQASEADSKLSSRAQATTEMRNILLREVGEFLQSEQTLREDETSREYSEKTEALTAGIVEMKTLDEQWNGVTYYIKAEMTVDPEDVNRRIAEARNDKQKMQELEASQKRIKDAEAEIARLKKELANADNRNNAALKEAYQYQTGILAANEYITRGNIALSNRWKQEAIAEYDKAYAQMPDNEATHRFMGDIYMKLDNSRAIKCYEKYLGTNPDGEKLIFLGDVLCYTYDEKKAESYYKRAESYYKNVIMNDPNNADAYKKLVYISCNLEDYKNAERYIQKTISIDPTYNAGADYSLMGDTYNNLNRKIQCYQKAIDIDPNNAAEYYNNMGGAYDSNKDYKEAIRCYQKAIDIDPNYAMAYYNIGTLYVDYKEYYEYTRSLLKAKWHLPKVKGYLQKAIGYLQKAIAIDPNDASAYWNMGIAYDKLDNKQERINCSKKAARLGHEKAQVWLRDNGYSW